MTFYYLMDDTEIQNYKCNNEYDEDKILSSLLNEIVKEYSKTKDETFNVVLEEYKGYNEKLDEEYTSQIDVLEFNTMDVLNAYTKEKNQNKGEKMKFLIKEYLVNQNNVEEASFPLEINSYKDLEELGYNAKEIEEIAQIFPGQTKIIALEDIAEKYQQFTFLPR